MAFVLHNPFASGTPVSPQWIIDMRTEIEEKLLVLIVETRCAHSFTDIIEMIYQESDADIRKIFVLFDCDESLVQTNEVLELVSDAWNYFPHKSLGGLSPMEKRMELDAGE